MMTAATQVPIARHVARGRSPYQSLLTHSERERAGRRRTHRYSSPGIPRSQSQKTHLTQTASPVGMHPVREQAGAQIYFDGFPTPDQNAPVAIKQVSDDPTKSGVSTRSTAWMSRGDRSNPALPCAKIAAICSA